MLDLPAIKAQAEAATEMVGELKAEIKHYKALWEEAQDKLERARTHVGLEARACPLCRYENGVFKEHCEPHRQLEEAQGKLRAIKAAHIQHKWRELDRILEGKR